MRGHFRFAFDGQDFLVLERNQSTWVPLAPGALNETLYWDAGHSWTLFAKEFLQEECVATLRSLLRGGTEALGRKGESEQPAARAGGNRRLMMEL